MKYRIFISSVQREFAKERKALASYIRKDAILGKFFEVFLFEEVPAQERKADGVYLAEVDDCDIYLGIFGHTYGNVDSRGVSATAREYRRAAAKHKYRICFVDKSAGETDPRQAAFIGRVNDDVVRKGFVGYDDLRTAVYAALAKHLEDKGLINVLPFDAAKTAGVTIKDLSVAKIRDFIRTARDKRQFSLPVNSSVEKLLTALELIDDDGNVLNPAALLFGKRPQKFFVASEVKCAQFYADRVSKPMADHQIYMGDVFELADQATRFDGNYPAKFYFFPCWNRCNFCLQYLQHHLPVDMDFLHWYWQCGGHHHRQADWSGTAGGRHQVRKHLQLVYACLGRRCVYCAHSPVHAAANLL